MALKLLQTFRFNDVVCVQYLCEDIGDELPLHSHVFNHITIAEIGEIECFTDDGKAVRCKAGDPPVEYVAGRVHGIRGVTAGAVFLNISPVNSPK